jgi:hypothetical protein
MHHRHDEVISDLFLVHLIERSRLQDIALEEDRSPNRHVSTTGPVAGDVDTQRGAD